MEVTHFIELWQSGPRLIQLLLALLQLEGSSPWGEVRAIGLEDCPRFCFELMSY